MKWALIVWLAVSGLTARVAAQTLVFDSVTRNYTLSFTDTDGNPHTLLIETANRVHPRLSASASGTGPWTYVYSLENMVVPQAQTSIAALYGFCSRSDPAQLVSSAEAGWRTHTLDRLERRFCSAMASGADKLLPGAALDSVMIVRSSLLLAIDTFYVAGPAVFVRMPDPEGVVDDTISQIIDRIQGFDGALRVLAPVPLRGPFSDLRSALRVIASDVTQSCDLGWISSDSVCALLQSRLRAASSAAQAGNWAEVRRSLGAFLDDITAGHERASPTIDANAFALHSTNAHYIRDRLIPRPGVRRHDDREVNGGHFGRRRPDPNPE